MGFHVSVPGDATLRRPKPFRGFRVVGFRVGALGGLRVWDLRISGF